jgi:hypothetical protein
MELRLTLLQDLTTIRSTAHMVLTSAPRSSSTLSSKLKTEIDMVMKGFGTGTVHDGITRNTVLMNDLRFSTREMFNVLCLE